MVKAVVPLELEDPRNAIGEARLIFGELLGWGAREAISMLSYSHSNFSLKLLASKIFTRRARRIWSKKR